MSSRLRDYGINSHKQNKFHERDMMVIRIDDFKTKLYVYVYFYLQVLFLVQVVQPGPLRPLAHCRKPLRSQSVCSHSLKLLEQPASPSVRHNPIRF